MAWWNSKDELISIPAPAIEDAVDELGLVKLNNLNSAIDLAMKKHLDPSNLGDMDDTGGHFGTEFNLRGTVGKIKSLYTREPWVNATSNLIARTLSAVPYIVRDVATDEILPDHPLNQTLQAGNQLNDANTVNWSGYNDLSLGGNFFRVLSDDYKEVFHVPVEFTELMVSKAFQDGDMTAPPIDSLRITGGHGSVQSKTQEIPWSHVVHHKMPNPYSPFLGMSMYLAASRPILLDRHKNEFEMAFYLRGATNSGVIETEEDLTKKRLERLMASFETSFTGRRNWWRTLWLPKTAKWVSNGMTMNEMQHLDGMRENRLTILAVLGVPASMVGIVQDVNRSTAESQENQFWQNTIIPMSQFIASGWNNSHLVKNVYRGMVKVEPEFSGIRAVEGSFVKKGEDTEAAKDALTINEIRTDIWGYKPLRETDPRGNMFISQVRTSGLFNNTTTDPDDMGPDEDDEQADEGKTVQVPSGDHDHSHVGTVDEDGKGSTTETSTGEDHAHELTGTAQEDGTIIVSTGPGGDGDHTHPDFIIQSEKGLAVQAFKAAKDEASRDQDRLERIQSEKYIRQYRKYLGLLVAQTEEALLKDKNVALHLQTLRPERSLIYDQLAMEVLYDTMDKSFTVAVSNSRYFTPRRVSIKAPRFTPTDEQAIEVLRKDREEGKRRRLRERGLERFFGFDDTASDLILALIEKGLVEGQTFQQIAKNIEKDFGENYKDQAFTVTRTEVLSAVSEGLVFEQEVLEDVFSEVEKQWFHVGDVGTNPEARDWHLSFETEGKKPPNHKWVSSETGARLGYPRDPAGGAKEVINCRCTMVTTVAEGATSNANQILEGQV